MAKKKWSLLAISDTHLGEDCSLLSYPHGRQNLWKALYAFLGGDDRFEVEQMIFIGDIPDRTLSSTSQIITQTNALVQTLGSVADVDKGIYIPGNHDHTLWKKYCIAKSGNTQKWGIAMPEGDSVVAGGARSDINGSAEEFLSLFWGYPDGSSWRSIQGNAKFEFKLANPLYITEVKGRTYVFTHGTHFRRDVTTKAWIKTLADYLQADRILGDIEIDSNCDVTEAKSLEGLERIVSPFVDSLWPSSKNNPTNRADQTWYLFTMLGGQFGKKRRSPDKSDLFSYNDLKNNLRNSASRIDQLTDENKSIALWREHFSDHFLDYLNAQKISTDNLTFVYGDTHDGGWGDLKWNSGSPIRIYNTGGWVVHNPDQHPACHIFAVDSDGIEYILDVSFKDVKVDGEALLKIASDEAENRSKNSSRILRFILNQLLD